MVVDCVCYKCSGCAFTSFFRGCVYVIDEHGEVGVCNFVSDGYCYDANWGGEVGCCERFGLYVFVLLEFGAYEHGEGGGYMWHERGRCCHRCGVVYGAGINVVYWGVGIGWFFFIFGLGKVVFLGIIMNGVVVSIIKEVP